jgi:hypothetical protein
MKRFVIAFRLVCQAAFHAVPGLGSISRSPGAAGGMQEAVGYQIVKDRSLFQRPERFFNRLAKRVWRKSFVSSRSSKFGINYFVFA